MNGAEALRDELLRLFREGAGARSTDEDFDRLARAAFAHQYAASPPYQMFCSRRGVTPDTVTEWRRIPPVPARAFKDLTFVSGPRGERSAVFRTSGTTSGAAHRGTHHVPDLALYDASALATFRHFVLPGGVRCRIVSLVPSPREAPDSSLSHMADTVMKAEGEQGSGWFASDRGLDSEGLLAALGEAIDLGAPVLLLGTSLALAAWLESLPSERCLRLPEGSRLMDTGGAKGRRRALSAEALRAEYVRRLGIPDHACVNEYGMTELCSQYYDQCLRAGARDSTDLKGSAPWLRPVAADPDTLAPLPDGEVGVLRHVDLANLGSIIAVQTEDVGRVVDGRVELMGRARGAEPRGCSLAMELLLERADTRWARADS